MFALQTRIYLISNFRVATIYRVRAKREHIEWAKLTYRQKEQRFIAESSLFGILVVFFADAKSDISLTGSDIARLRLAVVFYSPKNSRSEYHSAQAEYHCVAIELAAGE